LARPSPAAISTGPQFIPDSTLTAPKARRVLAAASYWGGQYTTATGELVTVYVSDSYPQDPAIAQRWADFLDSLVHGSELSKVTAYLAPLAEVQSYCGAEALACYSPRDSLLVAPGDAPTSDVSAEAVVTHEYGHHVASHRSNAPWDDVDHDGVPGRAAGRRTEQELHRRDGARRHAQARPAGLDRRTPQPPRRPRLGHDCGRPGDRGGPRLGRRHDDLRAAHLPGPRHTRARGRRLHPHRHAPVAKAERKPY